jgi:hypothetical protein
LIFLAAGAPSFARAKAEEEAREPLNKEWVLAITAFDLASLSPADRITGEVMTRTLADSLNPVDRRIRVSREYAYYEEYAQEKTLTQAGKTLAAKRAERDILLYQGNPGWKYRKNLEAVDAEIEKLEQAYEEAEAFLPNITAEPEFKLTADNQAGVFPPPPEPGNEYRFCLDQKADAFLAASVSEYHGRIFISLKLYTAYTRSFQYEDSTIFSPEDMVPAVKELAGRLTAAVSGTAPAAIAVRTNPPEAAVLIDEAFAGRGNTFVIERLPGEAEVRVFAENYKTFSMPVELRPGELAELSVDLSPLAMAALDINAVSASAGAVLSGVRIYRGALYAGEAPLTLDLPLEEYEYVYAETPGGDHAAAVYRGIDGTVSLELGQPRTGQTLELSRRRFYGAYGRFWIILPAAFVLSGVSGAYTDAYNYRGDPGIYNESRTYYYVSIAAMVAAGCALGDSFFRLYRYLRNSSGGVTRIENNVEPKRGR